MDPHRFFRVGLAALVVLGLLFAASGAIQQNAWRDGYLVGRLSAVGEDGTVAPYAPYGYPGAHYGFRHGFGGLGFWLLIGLLFVLFFGPGRHFFRGYGQPGRPDGGHWGQHGHRPPWWEEWQRSPGPQGERPGPESGAGQPNQPGGGVV